MTESKRGQIEEAVHEYLHEDAKRLGYDPNHPHFTIRTINPSERTAHIGRRIFSTSDLGELLRICSGIKVMGNADVLYAEVRDFQRELEEQGEDLDGQLPALWRGIFEAEIDKQSKKTQAFPGQFTNGNLDTLTGRMEGFVKHGIGGVFERLRVVIDVEGEDVAIIQRCPIHKFVATQWLPAYRQVRDRLVQEGSGLVPVEEVVPPQGPAESRVLI
jgi:DNA-binding transcriptional MerR regulator